MDAAANRPDALENPEIQPRLYDYMGGIIRAEKGAVYAIGRMPDHVHILFRWCTDRAVADLMRSVKAKSSAWVHQTYPGYSRFGWQEGYAVFSVGKSAEDEVKRYIENQPRYHEGRGYGEELVALLEGHGVEFDGKYLTN